MIQPNGINPIIGCKNQHIPSDRVAPSFPASASTHTRADMRSFWYGCPERLTDSHGMTDDSRGTCLVVDGDSDRGLWDVCIVHVGRRTCGGGACVENEAWGNCRRGTGYLPSLRSDGGLGKPIVVGSKVVRWARYFREPWKVPEEDSPQSYWAVRPRGTWKPPPRYSSNFRPAVL